MMSVFVADFLRVHCCEVKAKVKVKVKVKVGNTTPWNAVLA